MTFTTQARSDLVPQYMQGSLVKRTLRIAKIETKTKLTSGEKLVKAYNLAYSNGPTSASRLASVTECDGASTPVCLPPVSLTWQAVGTGFAESTWSSSSGSWPTPRPAKPVQMAPTPPGRTVSAVMSLHLYELLRAQSQGCIA